MKMMQGDYPKPALDQKYVFPSDMLCAVYLKRLLTLHRRNVNVEQQLNFCNSIVL